MPWRYRSVAAGAVQQATALSSKCESTENAGKANGGQRKLRGIITQEKTMMTMMAFLAFQRPGNMRAASL